MIKGRYYQVLYRKVEAEMLKTPTCERCTKFDYDGCKCKKYPEGVPDDLFFIPLEILKLRCNEFEKKEF